MKPQFEAGRRDVGKGGVVRDASVHRSVLRRVRDGLAAAGIDALSAMPSPLRGADGNVEFFFHARPDGDRAIGDDALDVVVDRAHTGVLP